MTELSDYRRLVEAPAIRSYDATIAGLRTEIARLTAELDDFKREHERRGKKITELIGKKNALKAERDRLLTENEALRAQLDHVLIESRLPPDA